MKFIRYPFFFIILYFIVLPLFTFPSKEEGRWFYSMAHYEEAEEFYKGLTPYEERAYLELAALYKELGEYNKAIECLKRYLIKYPQDKDAQFFLAQLLYLDGEDKEALHIIKKLKSTYKNYLIYLYTGLIYEELGNPPLAIKNYRLSLSYKLNSLALYRLGRIYYQRHNLKKARYYWEATIKEDSSFRLAYYYLGMTLFALGNYSKAYSYISKAYNFYPQSKKLRDKLSLVKKGLGKEYFLRKEKERLRRRKLVKLPYYKPLEKGIPKVRVAVLMDVREFSFKSGEDIELLWRNKRLTLRKDTLFRMEIKDRKVLIKDYERNVLLHKLTLPFKLSTEHSPFYILDVVRGKNEFWQRFSDTLFRGSLEIIESNDLMTVVNILSLEEYLYGVVPAEIYPDMNEEALKAQAVAARTIAFKNIGRYKKQGYDLCGDISCQVYGGMSKEKLSTNYAVDSTRGEVLVYKDEPIDVFYHSNSGGCLRGDLFGKRDYLSTKLTIINKDYFLPFSPYEGENWFKNYPESFSSFTKRSSNFRWQRIYDAQDFFLLWGWDIVELSKIVFLKKGDCEHIDELKVTRKGKEYTIKGDLKIRRYFDNLRSSAFKVEIKYKRRGEKKVPAMLLIWGAGFGHGVGMSQEGAQRMANNGYNYKQILDYYYPKARIKKVYPF